MRKDLCPTLLVVLAGFSFCVLNLLQPDNVFCVGGGCQIYADMEFLGVSFYLWGAILFAFLFTVRGGRYYFLISTLVLVADLPFLAWQIAFVPCSSCLTVSLLLTLNAFLARAPARPGGLALGTKNNHFLWSVVMASAIVMVVICAIAVFKERLPPWSINDAPQDSARVYFSPSCKPCKEHIQQLAEKGLLEQIALVPIAREEGDPVHIESLRLAYTEEGQAAFVAALLHAPPTAEGKTDFLLRVRLKWNQASLIRMGGTNLPWISGGPLNKTIISSSGFGVEQVSSMCGISPDRCIPSNRSFQDEFPSPSQ